MPNPVTIAEAQEKQLKGSARHFGAGFGDKPGGSRGYGEVGVDISKEFPKPWAKEFLGAADVVVTMGCGDSCPVVAGKRYEDWSWRTLRARPWQRSVRSTTRSVSG